MGVESVAGGRRIAALLPMVWSVRNVVYGGVLDRLAAAGVDVHLILPHGAPDSVRAHSPAFRAAAAIHELEAQPARAVRGKALLDGVIRSAFNRRYGVGSYPLYRTWYERRWTHAQRTRAACIEALGMVAQVPAVFDAARGLSERQYRRARDLRHAREQLERIQPDVLWSTFCVTPLEYPYYLAARDLGIPVVTSILSFDNLTSRGVIPDYDHYLVWHEKMRDQLIRLYPRTRPEQVTITGTTQFDFHRTPAYVWTREETLRRLGVPAGARYVLYAGSHVGLAPAEPELVRGIAQHMHDTPELRDLWTVVRIHPLETRDRWRPVTDVFPNVVVCTAWETAPDADGWTLSHPDDQAMLVSSLTHAVACVNVASTISLDAAILDRPVLGIDFSDEPTAPQDVMYQEYEAEHYRPLVQLGGLRLAHSWGELMTLIQTALDCPRMDSERRAAVVRQECGVVDGQAASRVAAAMLAQLGVSAGQHQHRKSA
ncbi:MAG TPA: hypothetical protein VJO52_00155 [Gemmatimonadaceae bacterium]|nr:hypothetical protein [Gemmatimonadaceae bacterium]